MAFDVEDTIVAIASPTTPAPRGVVRLSGEQARDVLGKMGIRQWPQRPSCFGAEVTLAPPLRAIDVQVLLWPTRRSYTGQPSAELHCVGALPILSAIVQAALDGGARAARPGEFTLRAFLAGRLDLTQAEAVLGVIEAEQRGSLEHALQQLAGNLSKPLEAIRSTLIDLMADVEAGLDFVDEDIEFIDDQTLIARLYEIDQQLAQTQQAMQARGGGADRPVVALRGEPNAGKSCLINRLAGSDVAIVTDVAGTTRDTVTSDIEIEGDPITLVDTAGIEQADSDVTRHAQSQAETAASTANVRLWCVDASRNDFDQAARDLREWAQRSHQPRVTDLFIATKSDLADRFECPEGWYLCSAVTGERIPELQLAIKEALQRQDRHETGSVIGTAARCAQSLAGARQAIEAAIALIIAQQGHELVASDLRSAVHHLGEVTGAVYTDDILDRVFSRFCIGK